MHQISLGQHEAAVGSMELALENARKAAETEAGGGPVELHESFGLAISTGYLGIARRLAGDGEGRALYEEACAAFEQMGGRDDLQPDANFGLGQLRHVWSRYGEAS